MLAFHIERKMAFRCIGQKSFIAGQENRQFAFFWKQAKEIGLISTLQTLSVKESLIKESVIQCEVFGISCVEKDPLCRAFDFLRHKARKREKSCFLTVYLPALGQSLKTIPAPLWLWWKRKSLLSCNGCRLSAIAMPRRRSWKFIRIRVKTTLNFGCRLKTTIEKTLKCKS